MTYSHRNGEIEPPTAPGYYWFTGDDWRCASTDGVFNVYMDFNGTLKLDDFPVARYRGEWWGPVTPPWDDESDSVLNGRVADLLQALQDRGEL